MKTNRDIVFLDRPASIMSTLPTAAEKCVHGTPMQTFHQYFQSDDQQFYVGIWECSVGSFRVEFTEHEFIHLLAGRVTVEDALGECSVLLPGMHLMIPAGFRGVWHVEEPVRKAFVSYTKLGQAAAGSAQ